MGFVDYAATLFRQNKKLKNSVRNKYFKKTNHIKRSKLRLNLDKVFHNSKVNLTEANHFRNKRIVYDELGIVGISIALTVTFFYFFVGI